MRVTIETENLREIEIIKNFLKLLDNTFIKYHINENYSFIEKGDKTIDFIELFGIWKDNPINLETLRNKA